MKNEIRALRVKQWLPAWDDVRFAADEYRTKPTPHFFVFAAPASLLRRLSGIARRKADRPRATDLGIQRRHEEDRSAKIARYLRHGYPWSELNANDQDSLLFSDLAMPGWLPTAIVANILPGGISRYDSKVDPADQVKVVDEDGEMARIVVPEGSLEVGWQPKKLPPVEIIDGQHRLWAFDESDKSLQDYELPVVAFYGLDLTWQAYLFWTINITPKRINASLAFDLYPLLRTQDWLESTEGPRIYQETRAQELTEALWAYPESPWHQRINMLGEPGVGGVTQASFIRSLVATYVKKWEGRRISIGGLFGGLLQETNQVLPWSRLQQAAFLVRVWQNVQEAVSTSTAAWAQKLRSGSGMGSDQAFYGKTSLLNTDQGVRGISYVSNDMCFVENRRLKLAAWRFENDAEPTDKRALDQAVKSLKREPVDGFLRDMAEELANFDWRSSAAEGLAEGERRAQSIYRGSGGYRELRRSLVSALESSHNPSIGAAAQRVRSLLGYE